MSERVFIAGVAHHRLRGVGWALLSCAAVLPGCVSDGEDLFPEPVFMGPDSTQGGDPNAASPVAPASGGILGSADVGGNGAVGVDPESPASSGDGSAADGTGADPEGVGDPVLDADPVAPADGAASEPVVAGDPTGGARVCAAPAQPLLLDFELVNNGPSQTVFGDFNSVLSGGTFAYPLISGATAPGVPLPAGLTSDVTLGDWHIAGSVTEPAGFGLFLDCQRLDASLFQGIAFRVAGSVASSELLQFLVGTAGNEVSRAWLLETNGSAPSSFGRCEPAVSQFDGSCAAPHQAIVVSPTAVEVFVSFAALAGGNPEPALNTSELTSIAWRLPDPALDAAGGVIPYAVDLHLDDIRFVELGAPTPAPITPVPVTPEPAAPEPAAPEPAAPEPAAPEPAAPEPGSPATPEPATPPAP